MIGTSLKVGGVASKILKDIPHHVPQVLINMEVVTPPAALSRGFDVMLLGAADDICTFLTANLGWGSYTTFHQRLNAILFRQFA